MSVSENGDESSDAFYKKVTGLISKHVLQSTPFSEKPQYSVRKLFI